MALGVSRQPLGGDMDQAVSRQPIAMALELSRQRLGRDMDQVVSRQPLGINRSGSHQPLAMDLAVSRYLSQRGSNSIPGQSMWNLWWTQCHWAGLYPSSSGAPVSNILPLLHTHSLIYQRRCITTANGSVGDTHNFRSNYFCSFPSYLRDSLQLLPS